MYAEDYKPISSLPFEHERLVVIRNPVSTKAANAPYYQDDIKENTGFKYPLVISSEPSSTDTIEKIADLVRPGDLLYVMGGDGLLNTVIQYAGWCGSTDVSVMTSDLGDACNAYSATTGKQYHGRPSEVIKNGRIETVYPIRAIIESEEESYSQLALTVVSVGAMATGAAMLGEPVHRDNRWYNNRRTRTAYQTYLSLCKGVPKLRSLEIKDNEDTEPRLMMDFTAANAPKVAKLARYNTEITDHDFIYSIIKDGFHLPWDMGAMLRQKYLPVNQQRIACGKQSVAFKLTESPRNAQARMQYDGEAQLLPRNAIVSIDQPGYNDIMHRPVFMVIAK